MLYNQHFLFQRKLVSPVDNKKDKTSREKAPKRDFGAFVVSKFCCVIFLAVHAACGARQQFSTVELNLVV
jgi:hypothetical protein